MKRTLLAAAIALALPQVAQAVTRYYAACDTGAHASCSAGSDSNDGLSASTPLLTPPTASTINASSCGDQYLFAKGSKWANYNSGIIDHGQNCQTNPVVIGDYDPPSGATGRPQLCSTTTDGNGFTIGSYNNTSDDRGYLFRGLELCGMATRATDTNTTAGRGFHIFGRVSYVTLDDMYIHNFRYGMEMSPEIGGSSMTIDHFTIKNSNISENSSMGFLGSADDFLITDLTCDGNNYSGSDRNHCIYLSPSEYYANYVTLRRITARNNSIPESWSTNYVGAGICTGGNITMHGLLNSITIEDSLVQQDTGVITGCYAYSVTEGYPGVAGESFQNIIVRRNKTVGVATAVAYESAPGIIIENTEVVANSTTVPNCYIYAGANSESQASAIIRNNSVHAHSGTAICADQPGTPTNQVVANNLTFYSSSTGTRTAFEHDAKSTYSFFDRNLYYNATRYSSTYTLGAQTANCPSGTASFDCNGLTLDPLFVATPAVGNGYSLQIQSGSPAVGAGDNTNCARLTKDGKVRTGTCTIGAYQPGL